MTKEVKVRVAVAVDANGDWNAAGWSSNSPDYDAEALYVASEHVAEGEVKYWLTAELALPVPVPVMVMADVDNADE